MRVYCKQVLVFIMREPYIGSDFCLTQKKRFFILCGMRHNTPLKISLFSLVLLITVSIDSVRNLPSTALFGPKLIFLYLLSSLFLLIPGSIAASEFAYGWPHKGGIFQWVSLGLGTRIGFLAVWGQWVNTLVWLPTILSFVAGSI